MKTINYLLITLLGLLTVQTLSAQTDTVRIEGKNQKRVIILAEGEESKTVLTDSNSTITIEMENTKIARKDSSVTVNYEFPSGKLKIENYSVHVLSDFSVGYASSPSSAPSNALYAIPQLKSGWNASFNFVKQNINLRKNKLFLSTALGLNYYEYSLQEKNRVPSKEISSGNYIYNVDSNNVYKTNCVKSKFLSVPIMLKWAPSAMKESGKFAIATGAELNFRNRVFSTIKIKNSEQNLRSETKLPVGFDKIVPSYIVRIQYGSIGIYGRYTPDGIINRPEQNKAVYAFGVATTF